MGAFIACGAGNCPLPWGHEGPCLPRPPRQVSIVCGAGSPDEIPVHPRLVPPESRGLKRVLWTVTVVVEEDARS